MKTFKKILKWLGIIILVLLIISLFLPRTYHVIRSTSIKSNKSVIYNLVANLNKWDLWTPWNRSIDSTAIFELKGPDGTIGTTRSWNGKVMGNGEMTITDLKPGELVAYDLSFQQGKFKSKGSIIIETLGDSCKVSWTDEGNLGYNPISRYMGLFMGRMLGPDFEKGLAKLKKVAEARANWPAIAEETIPAQTAIIITDSAGPKTFGPVMSKDYMELMVFIKENKLNVKGAPFARYLKWDSVTYFAVMDLGIPVEKADKGKGRIRVETIPAMKVVLTKYFGPYDKTGNTYRILGQYMKEDGLKESGGPWEVYITDPTTEKDPMKVETDILFPVK